MLQLIILATILFFIYIFRATTRNLNYWKDRGVKYAKPLPFLGNMLPAVTKSLSMSELVQNLYNQFPEERYVGMFQFTTPILFVRDPDLIKDITIKNFDNFVDHAGFAPLDVDPLWARSLFASEGNRWRDLRQTLSPVFTSSKMRTMFVLMDDCVKQLVTYFKEQNKDLIEVELKDICTRYTNDVIATTAFGIKCDSLKHQDNDFLLTGRELANFSGLKRFKFLLYGNYPFFAKLFNLTIVSTRVGNFFRSIITETIRLRDEQKIVRLDLIHFLMLARKGKLKFEDYTNLPEAGYAAVQESDIGKNSERVQFLTNEDITAQALIFFFGGFDTASSLMCFAGYELATNPPIQKRLKDEIRKVLQDTGGQTTYEHLLDMKYLDMVICETLRKWPQATWLDRKCTKTFEIKPEKKGETRLKVNVGDVCWIPVYAIHRDPHYYPNPEVFDPERFSEENSEKIRPTTYLPFGIGPRNCIGSRFALLETKILLFQILTHFDIVPTSKTQIPLKIDKNSILLLGEKGFHVGLRRTQATVLQ